MADMRTPSGDEASERMAGWLETAKMQLEEAARMCVEGIVQTARAVGSGAGDAGVVSQLAFEAPMALVNEWSFAQDIARGSASVVLTIIDSATGLHHEIRLLSASSIGSSIPARPPLLPAGTYRILVFAVPLKGGEKK